MSIRVVLADDQRVVREGLELVLQMLPDIDVVGVAANGVEAVALVNRERPDVVLMDLKMPEMSGVEATSRIRAERPEVGVVVLTTYADDESVFAALKAGARGYLTKDAGAEEISRALVRVASGQAMLDPMVQARVLDRLEAAPEPPVVRGGEVGTLTAREVEVLTLIAHGMSNAEIADHLVVGESTVKTHVNRIFAKTGLRDRAQVVAFAYRTGLARP
jgi:DNA-binding NarL/FixJ family response regulator